MHGVKMLRMILSSVMITTVRSYGVWIKSPYDITMYIDADMEVEHEDIVNVWDELKDHDMVFTALTDDRSYIYAERDFDTPEGKAKFTLCGAVCLYDMSKPIVREFMDDWWDLTYRQMNDTWWLMGMQTVSSLGISSRSGG